ncbi:MAG TPA: nucleotidyl transferase AbiEii/AbiGii toxin family protein [Candidatus Polarisedimenticolaceae bacterium]|nr:nucleotidyl transferase AbiEii/AbiGii toxin family protein [Candidatus Polarisedimenticolaceae bacterium]
MSPYETAEGLRRAIEVRLVEKSRSEGARFLPRLRRAVVFERIVTRLEAAEPGQWIPKGGLALEWRLGTVARTTKDLDLVVRAARRDAAGIHERLRGALAHSADGDHFVFEISPPEDLAADALGRAGYRFRVEARMAGRRFERVQLDVVPRDDEVFAVDSLRLPATLDFAGIKPPTVELASPAQHFAEKLHALTRDYGEHPNTRVRDLVDLMLLIERHLVKHADAFAAARHVFRIRATHALPAAIPDPPAAWVEDYPREAASCGVEAKTIEDALSILRSFWTAARAVDER